MLGVLVLLEGDNIHLRNWQKYILSTERISVVYKGTEFTIVVVAINMCSM